VGRRIRVRKRVVWLACSLLLFTLLITDDLMMAPAWLQPVTTRLYRFVYLALLPATGTASSVRHTNPSLEVAILGAASLLAPVLVWWVLRSVRMPSRPSKGSEGAIPRRRFMESAAWTVLVTGGATASYATAWEPDTLRVREYAPVIRDLPRELDGLRIVHVSDTHYGPYVTLPFLRKVLTHVNALRPDLVVLTGDYVHRTPHAIEPGIAVFEGLRSRFGAVAVLGNHDHWEGADACRAVFKKIGIPLIDNDRRFLTGDGLGTDIAENALCIAGVGDFWEDDVLLDKAIAGVPEDMPRLVLSHNPDVGESVSANQRVDLMLSGHTHGGQVWVPGRGTPVVPSKYGQKYAGGMCQGRSCPVLVSRGVGLAILPVRFGVPPEIGLVTLARRPV
jgi:uncharacterized protein